MAKTALSVLYGSVGQYLEVTLSTTTDPTKAEVTAWLNEAQRDIARQVPWQLLKDNIVLYNPSIAAVSITAWSGLTTDFIKFAYATLNVSGSATDLPMKLDLAQQASMYVTNSLMYDAENPILWFDATNINWLPATTGGAATGKLKFYYIGVPAAMSGDSDTPTVSEDFDEALVFYACAKARMQEEEWQQGMAFMQLYYRELEGIVKNYANWRL